MPEILLDHRLNALIPADDTAQEALRHVPMGLVKVRVKSPRNMAFHRKFFALLGIVFKNQSRYKSMDTLLCVCKLATGHAEIVRTKHGDVAVPKSISFAKMSGDEFSAFYERAVVWVLSDVIPGLKRKDLDVEVEKELREFAS